MSFPAARPPPSPSAPSRRLLAAVEPYHRLFQFGLGALACRHPDVRAAVGEPATWAPLHRVGGGLVLEGPRGRVVVVPTARGPYALNRAAPDVVRAVDDVVWCLLETFDEAAPTARPGKAGNAFARGIYYLLGDVEEREFVRAYRSFASARPAPLPLDDLFGASLA